MGLPRPGKGRADGGGKPPPPPVFFFVAGVGRWCPGRLNNLIPAEEVEASADDPRAGGDGGQGRPPATSWAGGKDCPPLAAGANTSLPKIWRRL